MSASNQVFRQEYANYYDMLYHDKDYGLECDLLEGVFQKYGNGNVHNILDLGCGTGNHAITLAQRGYKVTGMDMSTHMVSQAQQKAAGISEGSASCTPTFLQGDIRQIDLQFRFDAVLMMFAVLGYHLENGDVLSALKTARNHLRSAGLLIFDVWYGPAVLLQRPSERVKIISTPGGQILRFASGELDIARHVCTVHFHLWQLEKERLVAETKENHRMRYFFPKELDLFLECSVFAPVRLGAFPEFNQDPDETTWNVMKVARAV